MPLVTHPYRGFARLAASILAASIACAAPFAAASPQAFPSATPESQGVSADALSRIAAKVQEFVDGGALVGAELLVVKNRRTVLHRAFGLVDQEEQVAWELGTICNLRSMTKTFTGAAAQMLIDRGALALDDRVSKHLPGFDNDRSREITIEQLMTHRSGLPLSIVLTRDAMTKYASLIEQSNAAGEQGPEFEPGSKFWYSDAGSDALAAVVEKITGRTIDDFWRTELFEPLGMQDTFVPLDAEDPRFERIAPLHVGRPGAWTRFWKASEGPFYPFAWGSQSAYGTTQDYARFLAMWMDRGKVGERTVLSAEAVDRTLAPISPMSMLGSDTRFPTDFAGLEVWYGRMAVLHMPVDDPANSKPTIIGHSGSDGTIAWAWPAQDLMILLFTQSRGGAAILRVEQSIEELLLHPGASKDGVAAEIPERFEPMVGTYVANFAAFRNEHFKVLVKNGKLALDIPSQMVFELIEPAGDDDSGRWKFAIAPQAISVTFAERNDGRFDLLELHQAGMTFQVPRLGTKRAEEAAKLTKVDPGNVKPLLGEYLHPEANANVVVELQDQVLCLRSPEGVVFHFEPGKDDRTWTLKEIPGVTLTFEFDEQERVVLMTRRLLDGTLVMPRQRAGP